MIELSALFSSLWSVTLKVIVPTLNLVILLLLLLVAWLLAKGVQLAATASLKLLSIDKGLEKLGFTKMLAKAEIKRDPSELAGDILYWIVIVIAIGGVADFLGLGSAAKIFDGLLAYLPAVFSAALVLGIAALISGVVGTIVLAILANFGVANAKPISRFIQYALMVFGFLVSLSLLGIEGNWLVTSVSVIVGAIGLAFSIAFGLGCKDMAADFIYNLFKSK